MIQVSVTDSLGEQEIESINRELRKFNIEQNPDFFTARQASGNAPIPLYAMARDPNGRMDAGTVLDIQDWFYKEGMITQKFPAERLIDNQYADYAAKQLGPFKLINESDTLPSCR